MFLLFLWLKLSLPPSLSLSVHGMPRVDRNYLKKFCLTISQAELFFSSSSFAALFVQIKPWLNQYVILLIFCLNFSIQKISRILCLIRFSLMSKKNYDENNNNNNKWIKLRFEWLCRMFYENRLEWKITSIFDVVCVRCAVYLIYVYIGHYFDCWLIFSSTR